MKKIILLITFPILLLSSCSTDLDITSDWKKIYIVYGLLNPNDTVHYFKITKAFLGEGNAIEYAAIADSSNFPYKLNVALEAYDGNTLVSSFPCDTITLNDKDSGVFYFPQQRVYTTQANLSVQYRYRLVIRDTVAKEEVTAETSLVYPFSIDKPSPPPSRATFDVGKIMATEWISAQNGRRYQLLIRFNYYEGPANNPAQKTKKFVDWLVFNKIKSKSDEGGEPMSYGYLGDAFYNNIKANLEVDPTLERVADTVEYIFTVAGEDLNNYMEVTDPSNTIVQEKPIYSNIENGIGLFSTRTDNTIINKRRLRLSDRSLDELKNGDITGDLF